MDKHRKIPPLPIGDTNENPKDIGLFALLKEDWKTHERSLMEPGFWAVTVHRFGNWRMDIRPKLFRFPFTMAYRLLYTWVQWIWGIQLCYTVKLGRRVRLWHHGGMILVARSIGDDVHIRQNTTFGLSRIDEKTARPTIGNRVEVGCGACILGHISIGDDSVIGANAVVTKDVPPKAVVGGVPAKILRMKD